MKLWNGCTPNLKNATVHKDKREQREIITSISICLQGKAAAQPKHALIVVIAVAMLILPPAVVEIMKQNKK